MSFQDNFYSEDELQSMGFKVLGRNLKVSRSAHFYGREFISIGDNSRIDDFAIVSASCFGLVEIGKHVHLGAGVFLFGKAGIQIGDFAGISPGAKLFSESESFSGENLTNPTIPEGLRRIISGQIVLHKHCIIGAGSVVLPGVTLNEGVAVGTLSMVNQSLAAWGIYVGSPVRKIKDRSQVLLNSMSESDLT